MLRVSGKAPEGTSQDSTLALAMIALPALEWLSPDSLIANFPRFSPEGTTLVHSKSDDVTMGFDHGVETILLSLMPAPLPWSDLEQPCASAMLWPEATESMRPSTAHYIVTVMGAANPIRARVVLTRFIAAVLCSQGCCGVYWGDASLVHKPEMFVELAQDVSEEGFPALLWINFIIMAGSRPRSVSFFTIGMAAFGLMEIEVVDSSIELSELHERCCDLAGYLITSHQAKGGTIIKDGETFGWSAQEQFRVRHQTSEFGVPGKVYRLYC